MSKEKIAAKGAHIDSDAQASDKFKSRANLRFQSKARWTNSSQWKVSSMWKVSSGGDSMASMNDEMAMGSGVELGDPTSQMPKSENIKGVTYQYTTYMPSVSDGKRIDSQGNIVKTVAEVAPIMDLANAPWVTLLLSYLSKHNQDISPQVIHQQITAKIEQLGGLQCNKDQLNQAIVGELGLNTSGKSHVVNYIHQVMTDKQIYRQLLDYLYAHNERNGITQEMLSHSLDNNAFHADNTLNDAKLLAVIKSLNLNTGGRSNILEYIRNNPTTFVPKQEVNERELKLFQTIIRYLQKRNPEITKDQLEYSLHLSAFDKNGSFTKDKLNETIAAMHLKTGKVQDVVSYVNKFMCDEPSRARVEQPEADNKIRLERYKTTGKVEKNPAVKPTLSELAQQDPSGNLVTRVEGDLQNPNILHKIIPNNLFIDKKPHLEDVHQGNIGDCYFLAALLQVIKRDPQTIINMMKVNGSTVTTTFYHRKTVKRGFLGIGKKREWVAQDITVNFGALAVNKSAESDSYMPYGSLFRIAYEPKTSVWSANINNINTMSIRRENMYEAAMWLKCIEQAYMLFARDYGKYGKGKADASKNLMDGISGGHPDECMHMFFGNQIESHKTYNTVNDGNRLDESSMYSLMNAKPLEDDKLVHANRGILNLLYQYAVQTSDDKSYTFLMTGVSSSDSAKMFTRYSSLACKQLDADLKQNPQSADLRKASEILRKISDLAYQYLNFSKNENFGGNREGETSKQLTNCRIKIDKLSRELKAIPGYQALSSKHYKTLEESIGIIVANVRSSEYERKDVKNLFIFSKHAYSINAVTLFDTQGNRIETPEQLKNIDLDASKVTLGNPHGTNKATLNEVEQARGRGDFDISLRSYLNHAGSLYAANFKLSE